MGNRISGNVAGKTRAFFCLPLLAQPLERGKPLPERFHNGDLLAERAAGDVAAPLRLALQDVGDVGIDGFKLLHVVI